MQARHVGGHTQLHTAAGKTDGIQVILHLGLNLSKADEFVQLIHRGASVIADHGDVFRQHQFQLVPRLCAAHFQALVHGRNNLIVKEVLYQQGVLKAHAAVVVLVQDIHLEFLSGLVRQFETARFTVGVKHAEQLLGLEIFQINGLREALFQIRVAGKKILHPLGFSHEHQHPAFVFLFIVQAIHQGTDNAALGVVIAFVVGLIQVMRPVNDQRAALGPTHGTVNRLVLGVDAGGGQR